MKCRCDKFFCNLCKEDAHKPLSCEKLEKWRETLGGADTDDNKAWIKLNSKSCPGCKTNIEKNQGCNHMTCKQCKYEFCWLCLGEYRTHRNCTGY